MSKLYELAIENGDNNPVTTFRVANDIEQLTEFLTPLRLMHPHDVISVWEITEEMERSTTDAIHIFGRFIEEIEQGKVPMPPMPLPGGFPFGMPGFVELSAPPGEICNCDSCDCQLDLDFEDF